MFEKTAEEKTCLEDGSSDGENQAEFVGEVLGEATWRGKPRLREHNLRKYILSRRPFPMSGTLDRCHICSLGPRRYNITSIEVFPKSVGCELVGEKQCQERWAVSVFQKLRCAPTAKQQLLDSSLLKLRCSLARSMAKLLQKSKATWSETCVHSNCIFVLQPTAELVDGLIILHHRPPVGDRSV